MVYILIFFFKPFLSRSKFFLKFNNQQKIFNFDQQLGLDLSKYLEDIYGSIIAFASGYAGIEMMKYLLKVKDINVNLHTEGGESALFIASDNNNKELVKLLLKDESIDVNIKCMEYAENNERTPLINACIHGYFEIVELLLGKEGIDINATDSRGYSALRCAIEGGHFKIVKLLMEKEALVDSSLLSNSTPKLLRNIDNNRGETLKTIELLYSYEPLREYVKTITEEKSPSMLSSFSLKKEEVVSNGKGLKRKDLFSSSESQGKAKNLKLK